MSPQRANDITDYMAAIEGSNQSCGGVDGHAPTCRADIDPAVNRREGRLQQGLEAGLKPSPHDANLVEMLTERRKYRWVGDTSSDKLCLVPHEMLCAAIDEIKRLRESRRQSAVAVSAPETSHE